MVRIGVIGLGFGEHHVRTLSNMGKFELVAVADFQSDRLNRIAEKYGCRAFDDATKMMDQAALDAVSVCVSPAFRAPILKAATERELAIFAEKPWGSNGEHAEELASICAKNPAPIMAGFSFRFHPVVRRAMELVPTELGAARLGSGAYVFDWLPSKSSWMWDPANGGGIFNENSCHLFDVVCALAGQPVELFAYGIRDDDRPSEKAATVAMRFASGATVTVVLGGIGAKADTSYPWLELYTEGGFLRLSGEHHLWRRVEWTRREDTELHQTTAPPEQLGRTRYTDAFEHFAECVESRQRPGATIDDGVLMVRIADAVKESFGTGKPVSVPARSAE